MRDAFADALRTLAAASVLLSAAVHLDLWELQGFRDIPTIGPLFLLNGLGGIALGVTVVVWRHWLAVLAAAGFGAVTVAAFWISVLHGLFGFKELATGPSQVLAEMAEYAAFGLGLAAAYLLWHDRRVATG